MGDGGKLTREEAEALGIVEKREQTASEQARERALREDLARMEQKVREREHELTFYVTIGNSDDKLTQMRWHQFISNTDAVVNAHAKQIYGFWHSPAVSSYQNCIWGFSLEDGVTLSQLEEALSVLAFNYRQQFIALSKATVKMIPPIDPVAKYKKESDEDF